MIKRIILLFTVAIICSCAQKQTPPFAGIAKDHIQYKDGQKSLIKSTLCLGDLLTGETAGGEWTGYEGQGDNPCIETDNLLFGETCFTYTVCFDTNGNIVLPSVNDECCASATACYYKLNLGDISVPDITICDTITTPILLSDFVVGSFGTDATYLWNVNGNGFEQNTISNHLDDTFIPLDGSGTYTGTLTCTANPLSGYTVIPGCEELVVNFNIIVEDCDCNSDIMISGNDCDPLIVTLTNCPTMDWNNPACFTWYRRGVAITVPLPANIYLPVEDGAHCVEVYCCTNCDTLKSNIINYGCPLTCNCNVSILGNAEICEGETTSLTTSLSGNCASPITYLWDDNSTNSFLNVSPIINTTYCVTVTDDNGCTGSDCFDLVVSTSQNVVISNNGCDITIDQGDIAGCDVIILFDDGTGQVTLENPYTGSFPYVVTQNGDYTFILDCGGCIDTSNVLTVNCICDLEVDISGDLDICFGETTLLTANPTNVTGTPTYLWSNTLTTSSITVSGGTYSVTVTDDSGCTATDEVIVTEFVFADLTFNIVGCELISISTPSGCTWELIDPNGVSLGQVPIPFLFTEDGDYFFRQTCDPCPAVDLVPFTISGCQCDLEAEIECPVAPFCFGDQVTISTMVTGNMGVVTYQWFDNSTSSSNTFTLNSSGTYCVTVTDTGVTGCQDVECCNIVLQENPTANMIENMCQLQLVGALNGCTYSVVYCDPTLGSCANTSDYTFVSNTLPYDVSLGSCPGDGLYRLELDCPCGTFFSLPPVEVTGCNCCDCIVGDIIEPTCPNSTLTSNVQGCTGFSIQWQYRANAGLPWGNLPGETGLTHDAIDNGFYRYCVTHPDCPLQYSNVAEIDCFVTCDCEVEIIYDDVNCNLNYRTKTGTDCTGWSWSFDIQTGCTGSFISIDNGVGNFNKFYSPTNNDCFRIVAGLGGCPSESDVQEVDCLPECDCDIAPIDYTDLDVFNDDYAILESINIGLCNGAFINLWGLGSTDSDGEYVEIFDNGNSSCPPNIGTPNYNTPVSFSTALATAQAKAQSLGYSITFSPNGTEILIQGNCEILDVGIDGRQFSGSGCTDTDDDQLINSDSNCCN